MKLETDINLTPQEFLAEEQRMLIEFWNKFHEVFPQFGILRSTGKMEHFVASSGIRNDRDKDAFHASMKKICSQPNVLCLIHIEEVWVSMNEAHTLPKDLIRPSEDPNRRSAIICIYYTPLEGKMYLYEEKDSKLELTIDGDGQLQSVHNNPFKGRFNLKDKKFN